MEILHTFGIDPILLGAQVVNFLIILFLLKRFLFKPILEVLKNREQTIKEGIRKSEEATKMFEQAQVKEKELLRNAQIEAKKLLADAKSESADLLKEAENIAKKQTEKTIQEAKAAIEKEAKQTEAKLAYNVSSLAIAILKKSLGDLANAKTQEEILTKALKQMKNKPN